MITRGSIRRKNKKVFQKVITLRKQGFSYTEIKKEIGVAKSTINNWLSFAGLTLSPEHQKIQTKKRLANHVLGTEASKITRSIRKEKEISGFLERQKKYFSEPLYNYGIALYESEGSKVTDCRLSNSDYRLVLVFIKFMEVYLRLKKEENMVFEVYVHDTRTSDLSKIKAFWSRVIGVPTSRIRNYWKHNSIKGRKLDNPDYMGQMTVRVKGERILGSKLHAVSDIILKKYQKLHYGIV